MMDLLRSKLVLVFLSLAIFSSASVANTVNQEKAKLTNLQQALTKQQQNYADIQDEIKDYPEKLKSARDDLVNSELELDKAKAELQNLKIEASKPGADLERDIKLKEHSVKMAERRASREGRSLERVKRDEGALQEEATKIKSTVDRLTRQVQAQERQVAETEAIARRQEQEIKTPKPVVDIPAPPVAAPAVARPAPQPAPRPAPAPVRQTETVRAVPDPIPAEQLPALNSRETVAAQAPATAKPTLAEEDYEAYLVAERVTNELKIKATKGGNYDDITLKGSDIADTTLTHVGERSFRGEAIVVAGDQRLRVKNNRFRMSVPERDDGETYVFVVDQKKVSKPKVFYFKKSLTAFIGTNPIVKPTAKASQPAVAAKPQAAAPAVARTANVQKPAPTNGNLSEDDLEGIEVAREQVALLEDLKSLEGTDKPFFDRLTLSGKSLESAVNMEYLYRDQYAAETVVEAGRQLVKVNTKKFRIVIPEQDDGETYMFYIDASNPQRLQLTFFKKSLMGLL